MLYFFVLPCFLLFPSSFLLLTGIAVEESYAHISVHPCLCPLAETELLAQRGSCQQLSLVPSCQWKASAIHTFTGSLEYLLPVSP